MTKHENEEVAERFVNDIKAHEMSMKRDDGVYRHIIFSRSKSSSLWFEIVTWPGCLTINGDMGCYTFSRNVDMFDFFRDDDNRGPNFDYWAEKIMHGGRDAAKSFDRDIFIQYVENQSKGRDAQGNLLAEASDVCNAFEAYNFVIDRVRPRDYDGIDFNTYTYHYRWCCHAIVYAIRQYDRHKKGEANVAA